MLINEITFPVNELRTTERRRRWRRGFKNCENELRTHYVVVRGTVA